MKRQQKDANSLKKTKHQKKETINKAFNYGIFN